MLVGILHFGEPFTSRTLLGFVLVVCAVVLVILNKNRENSPFVRLRKLLQPAETEGQPENIIRT